MKRYRKYLLLSIILEMTFFATQGNACLTFCMKNGQDIIYGRNFDWFSGAGAVIINQRNVRKTAFVIPPERPMSWISKYGSVTFNQFSKELPVGGMNEHGLVIESLVSVAEHPPSDRRETINELQWIQYHLDTCKTIEEVIKSARVVRITRYALNLHYFVSDNSGKSVVIEFLDKKMEQRSADTLPVKVLANTDYDTALMTVTSKKKSENTSRFARASQMIKTYNGKKKPVEYAFAILNKVSQGDFTKWQVVYDLRHKKIYYRSLLKKKTKIIELPKFDFKNTKETLIIGINTEGEGSVHKQFNKYSNKLNDDLIKKCQMEFKKAGMDHLIKTEDLKYIKKAVASCKYEEEK